MKVGEELVPDGVKLTVPFVPAGVKLAVPFVPVAVRVWVCVASAEPVKVCAVTVRLGAVALQAVVEPVPAAILVAAQFPEVAEAPLVPAGVPALTAEVVALEPVKVWAGTVPAVPVKVSAGTVPAFPVNVGAATLPVGVMVELPPEVPTSPFAATVPRSILPFNAATSLQVAGQLPETIIIIIPEGRAGANPCPCTHDVVTICA